jgi:hypothetical protein
MATWAYECRPSDQSGQSWLVGCQTVDAMPADAKIVRVKAGSQWHCATVDRTRRIEVEAMLLREVIASDEVDCPECAEPPNSPAVPPVAPNDRIVESTRQIQAAEMTIGGRSCTVVLVGLELINSPGEAHMATADLFPLFPGAEVVLMGQEEDGTPHFHGPEQLVNLLASIPLDQMPWRSYPLG